MMPGDDQARNERDMESVRRPLKLLDVGVGTHRATAPGECKFYRLSTYLVEDYEDLPTFYVASTVAEAIVYARGLIDARLNTAPVTEPPPPVSQTDSPPPSESNSQSDTVNCPP